MRTSATILFLIALLLANTAFAAGWACNGAQFENLESGSTSCVPMPNDGVPGDHSFGTRDCPDSATAGFVCHGHWVPGMPLSGTVPLSLEAMPDTTGNVCVQVKLGCPNASASNSFGAASKQSIALTSGFYSGIDFTSVAVPGSAGKWYYCTLHVLRVKGDGTCTDNVTGDVKFRDAAVNNQ